MRIEPLETIPAATVALLAEAVAVALFLVNVLVWMIVWSGI